MNMVAVEQARINS